MSRAPRVAAIVLAAGRSRRMGRRHKLLLRCGGRPLVAVTVARLRTSRVHRVVVVTGYQGRRLRRALAGSGVRCVHNRHYARGLSESIRVGCAALPPDTDAVLICLADMPSVGSVTVNALIAAFDPGRGRDICVPTFAGARGNPVLWSRRFLSALTGLTGDAGARRLLYDHAESLAEVAVCDAGVCEDVDSPRDLARLRCRRGSRRRSIDRGG